jgi:hypothetical protein
VICSITIVLVIICVVGFGLFSWCLLIALLCNALLLIMCELLVVQKMIVYPTFLLAPTTAFINVAKLIN